MTPEKLQKLLDQLRAQHSRMGDQLDAFEAMLLETHTPGQAAKQWLLAFGEAWAQRYRGEKFIVASWPKDMAIAKRLLAQLEHEELLARARGYLADPDPFYVRAKHPIGLFATNVNRYAKAAAHEEDFLQAPAIGCTHRPQCKSDVQHTRRVSQELRA